MPTRLHDVGLAFLKRVGSKTKDSIEAEEQAREVMATWERPKSPETRSVAPEVGQTPAIAAEPQRRVIRRPGGVAEPTAGRPRQMSGDEVRDMLGLRRLREGDIPPSGMGATVRRLGRTSALKGEMVTLNVQLRGLYIDALDAHESGDRETYKKIMDQISDVERQLAGLRVRLDAAETDT